MSETLGGSRIQVGKGSGAPCRFIGSDYVMPGWGCCSCGTYNGLQRERCIGCGHVPCLPDEAIPAWVQRCADCGFGFDQHGVLSPCPCCGYATPPAPREAATEGER